MRLPAQERRRQIIDTAVQLFCRKGFSGTTTREVAKAAGVSEATLFKHFSTKEDLYAAIIEAKAQSEQIVSSLVQAAERQDDVELLRTLATEMIERARTDSSLMRLLFFSALEGHALSDMFFRSRMTTIDVFLGRYIAGRIAAGAFRPADPMQAAWNFMGMITVHVLRTELFGQKSPPDLTTAVVVEQMVSLFLQGVRA